MCASVLDNDSISAPMVAGSCGAICSGVATSMMVDRVCRLCEAMKGVADGRPFAWSRGSAMRSASIESSLGVCSTLASLHACSAGVTQVHTSAQCDGHVHAHEQPNNCRLSPEVLASHAKLASENDRGALA